MATLCAAHDSLPGEQRDFFFRFDGRRELRDNTSIGSVTTSTPISSIGMSTLRLHLRPNNTGTWFGVMWMLDLILVDGHRQCVTCPVFFSGRLVWQFPSSRVLTELVVQRNTYFSLIPMDVVRMVATLLAPHCPWQVTVVNPTQLENVVLFLTLFNNVSSAFVGTKQCDRVENLENFFSLLSLPDGSHALQLNGFNLRPKWYPESNKMPRELLREFRPYTEAEFRRDYVSMRKTRPSGCEHSWKNICDYCTRPRGGPGRGGPGI